MLCVDRINAPNIDLEKSTAVSLYEFIYRITQHFFFYARKYFNRLFFIPLIKIWENCTFEIVLQRIETIWKKWQVIHHSSGFKRYDRENSSSSSRNTSLSAGSNSLLNLTLQELGTLKRDWAISSRIYPESKQPLPRTRDIPLPPGTRDSLISLRTHAYGVDVRATESPKRR